MVLGDDIRGRLLCPKPSTSLTRFIPHVLLTLSLGPSSLGRREGVCVPLLGLGRAFPSALNIRTWLRWWCAASTSPVWLSLSLGIRPPCHKEAQTTGGSHLWVCIRHVFSSDALSPEALLSMAGGQGGLPLPDQIVNNAPVSSPFIANQSTWRPSLPSSIRLQATNLLPPSLQGQAPYGWGPPLCPEPAELTQTASPTPARPASPAPPRRNRVRACASLHPPRSVRLVTCPAASLGGPARHGTSLLSGTVRNKLSFQWQSSPDLVASPYLNDKQIYI